MKDARYKRTRTVFFPLHDFLLVGHPERVTLARGATLHRRAPALHEIPLMALGQQEQINLESGVAHWLAVLGTTSHRENLRQALRNCARPTFIANLCGTAQGSGGLVADSA